MRGALTEKKPGGVAAPSGLGRRSEVSRVLSRFGSAVSRSRSLGSYLQGLGDVEASLRAGRLAECGSWLWLREYFETGDVRVKGARFCQQALLCQFCSIRRAALLSARYVERLRSARDSFPAFRSVLVTLTLVNGEDLSERFSALSAAMGRFVDGRRKARSGHRWLQRFGVVGGVAGIEVKRGRGSGLWHPHSHWLMLLPVSVDLSEASSALSAEWRSLTGDSFVVDVRPVRDEVGACCEVLKYIGKFSEAADCDVWHAFGVLSGRRLRRSFGVLHGVADVVSLVDVDEGRGPYADCLYRFADGRFVLSHVRADGSAEVALRG